MNNANMINTGSQVRQSLNSELSGAYDGLESAINELASTMATIMQGPQPGAANPCGSVPCALPVGELIQRIPNRLRECSERIQQATVQIRSLLL